MPGQGALPLRVLALRLLAATRQILASLAFHLFSLSVQVCNSWVYVVDEVLKPTADLE